MPISTGLGWIDKACKKGEIDMNSLKKENLKKCFSLLKEYLDEAPLNKKKGGAVLALEQLQKITAGVGSQDIPAVSYGPVCINKPRASGSVE